MLLVFFNAAVYAQSQTIDENYLKFEKYYLEEGDSSLYYYRFSKMYHDQNDHEKALLNCEKALFFAEKHYLEDCNKLLNLINIVQDIIDLYMTTQRYSKALYVSERFLKQIETLNPSCQANQEQINWNIAFWLDKMSNMFHLLADYPTAQNFSEKAIKHYETKIGRKDYAYAILLNTAGLVQYDQKFYQTAITYYKEAYEIVKNHEDPYQLKSALEHNLAGSYAGIKGYEKAKKMNWELYQNTKDLNSLHNLGMELIEKPQPEDVNYPDAEWCFKEVIAKTDLITLKNNAYCKLALIYSRKKRFAEAHEAYYKGAKGAEQELKENLVGLSEQQQIKFLQGQQEKFFFLFYDYASRYLEYQKIRSYLYDVVISTKSSVLYEFLEVQKSVENSPNAELKQVYAEWRGLTMQMQNLQDAEKRKAFAEKSEKLKTRLAYLSESFRNFQMPATWQEIQSKLKATEAAIEIVAYEYQNQKQYLALILRQKETPFAIKLPSDLGSKAVEFHQSTKTNFVEGYEAFWQSFEPYLEGIQSIYFAPDGAYNLINLNILQEPQTKVFLGDKYRIYLLNNTKELLNTPRKYTENTALLLGNPDFNAELGDLAYAQNLRLSLCENNIRSLNLLPYTDLEVETIKETLPKSYQTEVLKEKVANKNNLLKTLQVKSPKILHLATHGAFCPNSNEHPLYNSFLALAGLANSANEKLTAYEILHLDLQKTEIAVLSACETGKGAVANGEGVMGMARAFQGAGVRNVVMSLWKVDDQATQVLMHYLYENWAKEPNLHEALRQAQKRFRAEHSNRAELWGGFVIWGK